MFPTKFEEDKIPRKVCPHHVVVTFKIDVRKIKKDGTLDNQVIGNNILSQYGISNKGQICFSAPTEAECIKLVKEKLENLNG
jgi:hypothetical protein